MNFKRLRRKLASESSIKSSIQLCFYSIHMSHQVKRSYQALKLTQLENSALSKSNSRKNQRKKTHKWDWKESVFDIRPSLAIYEIITTAYFLYGAIKYTFPAPLEILLNYCFEPELPVHCYLLGRFVISSEVKVATLISLSWAHLAWRLSRRLRHMEMNSFYFLLFSKRDVNHYLSYLRRADCDESAERRDSTLNTFKTIMIYKSFKRKRSNAGLSEINIMYKLRPNRTAAAQEDLRQRAANIILISTGVYFFLASIMAPMIIYNIFDEQEYLDAYPNCNPEPSRQLFGTQLDLHRCLALLFDFIENFIYYVESGSAAMYTLALCNIANMDALFYWRWLHENAKELNERTQLASGPRNCSIESEMVSTFNARVEELQRVELDQRESSSELLIRGNEESELKQLVVMYLDLFKQIESLDTFMSDILSMVLTVWALFITYSVYLNATSAWHEKFSPESISMPFISACVASAVFTSLLVVQRRCRRTYPILCSLLAYHQDPLEKRRLEVILNYFEDQKTFYTLFGHYPVQTTTFLKIISWSISCFFIASSTIRRM